MILLKPQTLKRYIVVSDVHVPFHNELLCNKIFKLCYNEKFDGLVIAGDFMDMFSISKHSEGSLHDLRAWTLGKEYKLANKILDSIDELKIPEKHFLFGNHEQRFERWIKKGDNAKLIGALKDPTSELKLKKRGYNVIEDYPNGTLELAPKLHIVHGIYTNIHASKKHAESSNASIIFGHTHRFGSFFTDHFAGFNIGGLFDKHSKGFDYTSWIARKQWLNGFAVVTIDEDLNWYVNMVNCYHDRFVFSGKLY